MTSAYLGITFSVTALLAVMALNFKLGNWYGEVNSDRTKFNEFMDEMRKNREEIRKDFQKLRKDIQEFRKDFQDVLRRFPSSSTISDSPIHHTEIGERISIDIGA